MATLVSIDPHKHKIVAAFWRDSTLCRLEIKRIKSIALSEVEKTFCDHQTADTAVVEEMIWYPGTVRSQPNDLLQVARIGMRAASLLGHSIVTVPAQVWKGSTPKKIMENRIFERLDEEEAITVRSAIACYRACRLDIIDAVGIGLHHLWRLG